MLLSSESRYLSAKNNSTLIEKRFMNMEIKWNGSCQEVCAAAFSVAQFGAAYELGTFG